MSNSTTRTSRSSAPSRGASSPAKKGPSPSRSSQASTARQATTSTRPSTKPQTTTAPQTTTEAKTTTPAKTTIRPGTDSAAVSRLQSGQTPAKETNLQTGKDGFEQFEDRTKDGAQVPDFADRMASSLGGDCPDGNCAGGGGEGGGGGGGFMDKLLQLGQMGVDIAKTAIEASAGAAEQGMGKAQEGIDKAKELYGQATTRFNFDDQEKQELTQALGTLKKLAGDDGRWNEQDLANNSAQLKAGWLARPVIENGMRKGVEETTGRPVEKLTAEQKKEALDRWNKLSPEEQQKMRITQGNMEQFRDATDMLKARAKALGLPETKMPNGMSVDFMQSVIENAPGWQLMFKR